MKLATFWTLILISLFLIACQPEMSGETSQNNLEVIEGKWTTGNSLQTERTEVAAAVVKGKLYVVGGFQKGISTKEIVEVLDPEIGQWKFGKQLPLALDHTAAVSLNDKLYIIGGYQPGWQESDKVFTYDPP